MIRVLFICHGNICRSPMAQFIMQDLVRKSGLQDCFQIASAATSTEEIGNSIYPYQGFSDLWRDIEIMIKVLFCATAIYS